MFSATLNSKCADEIDSILDRPVDYSFESRRLRKNLLNLVRVSNTVFPIGHANLIENIAALDGWRETEFVAIALRSGNRRFCVLTAPASIWRNRRQGLIEIKRKAAEAGFRVMLISPQFIQREPRMSNTRAVADTCHIFLTAEDRMAVLLHVLENGYSTLQDCASVIVDSEAPYSAVLSLAGMGLLDIDLDKPLSANTRVDLRQVAA
ncbi:hypothetical protein [Devosia sp. Root685]|uniref:hypothetical protein n=1 Tax=Devosia sp. Root685 TaxID=1736587 RepID=UPI000B1D7888|nr:hypothetical protein [Devosia sp. Root685]